MTEYDYSPEAYEAYLATQAKISRWVNKTNRLYPHLGNPFTPATPAPHGSDLPQEKGKDGDRSPLKREGREREQDIDRGGNFNTQREKDGVSEKERKRDRHRDKDQEKYLERDRDRHRSQANDHNSSESHSDPRSRSRSRPPPPPRSKSTPREPPRTPHSRRASYDQYTSQISKYHSKHDLNSTGYSHRASKSKPDLHSSKSKYSSKYDSDIPSASSSRKHSSSSTHLPQNHLPSRHRASASTHHLPITTSPPPLTSHHRYPSNPNPSPAQRQPMRSQTMPQDRSGGPSWLAPQPPPLPVIPQGGYHATQGQGYYYSPKGTALPNERRVIPPPLPIRAPEPEHGHGHGHHTQGRGQKGESPKHQQPLLKRLLTNLTLGRQTGSPTSSHRVGRRRKSF